MTFRFAYSRLILSNTDSLFKRLFIFFASILVWWTSEHYLRPLLGSSIRDLRNVFGNGPFIQNIFSQSLPVDLVCFVGFLFLWKARIIPMPKIKGSPGLILKEGLLWGLFICVPTIPLAMHLGYHIGFSPNWQSILGNVISNSYEEFTYRVFLFSVAAYAFRNIWIAVLISAFLFATIHSQYPISMQFIVALAAVFFSFAYIRSGSILSAVLAHEISDMILDSILIR